MSHQFFFSPHILDNLNPPASGFEVVQDISEPRLRLYITARGVKTFFTRKRVLGRDARLIIGRYPDIDIDNARVRVNEILATVDRPVQLKRKQIGFEKLVNIYMSRKVNRTPASMIKIERTMARLWAEIYQKNIDEITTDELKKLNFEIAKNSGAPTANRMLELMGSIFKFAIESGYLKESPINRIEKIQENRRVPTLSQESLRQLIDAINNEKNQNLRNVFLMLIYGFESRSKIFAMQWRDLDFNNDTWGNRPLSDLAVVLLRDMAQDGRFVFPGRLRSRHISDPRAAWARIVKNANIGNVKMDDVHKFLMRRLCWSGNRETLRRNMNSVLELV